MPRIFNNSDFCKHWKTSAEKTDKQYCRKCNSQPCKKLWALVKRLASANNFEGTEAKTSSHNKPFKIYTTPRQSPDICYFQSLASNRAGKEWCITKEDFLYVLKTGNDNTPSDTRQKSHVEPIIEIIEKQYGQDIICQIEEM